MVQVSTIPKQDALWRKTGSEFQRGMLPPGWLKRVTARARDLLLTLLLLRAPLLLLHGVVVEPQRDAENPLPVVDGLQQRLTRGDEVRREQSLESVHHDAAFTVAQLRQNPTCVARLSVSGQKRLSEVNFNLIRDTRKYQLLHQTCV